MEKGRCDECGGWHAKTKTIHLSYVGHAALTSRLLDADPMWTWEPLAITEQGLPRIDANGGMWIKLTVCGVTRLGYGDAQGKTGPAAIKETIGDALRNAAMRFGAALELWHKGTLNLTSRLLDADPLSYVGHAALVEESHTQDVDGSEVDLGEIDTLYSRAMEIIDAEDMDNGPEWAVKFWEGLNTNTKMVLNEKLNGTIRGKRKCSTIFRDYLAMATKAAMVNDYLDH